MLTFLATNENNTFIEVQETAISDMTNNHIVPITQPSALQVENYTADISSPILESFDLDMNAGTINLHFSETVNGYSFNALAITLVQSAQPFAVNYTIQEDGESSTLNTPSLALRLSDLDENNLKRIVGLASNPNDTYLLITSELVVDMDGNAVENETIPTPLPVHNFTEDSTSPVLVNFDLNLTSDILTLTFSETVNASSLNISSIFLQADEELENTTEYLILSDSNTLNPSFNDPILEVNISRQDGNELRRLRDLAVSVNSLFLSLEGGAVVDMVSLPVVAILNSSAKAVQNFTRDEVRPELEEYSLNLTTEILVLSFSETVDIASFEATQITLYGSTLSIPPSYTLTGGIVLNTDDSPYIELALTTPDLNAIKLDTLLATVPSNTYISLTDATVSDVSMNPVLPISTPERADNFGPDEVRPTLVEYDIDLNSGLLRLIFSESVNTNSFDVTQLSLQPAKNITFPPFSFTATSATASPNGTEVFVNIGLSDLNELKRQTDLAVDNETTFLSITSEAIEDMNSNRVLSNASTDALQVSVFVSDTTPPQLVSFFLDLDTENLTLSFSETVNASSISVTALTFVNEPAATSATLTLTEGITSINNGPIVTVALSEDDLNRLKYLTALATEENNTYIAVNSSLIEDVSGNALDPISLLMPLRASRVYQDETHPQLQQYLLDINTGELTFTFTESVNASSFNPTQLTLQSNVSLDSFLVGYTLRDYPIIPLAEENSSTVITLTLTVEDLNAIKKLVHLATNANNTYLSFTSDFLADQFGNQIEPVTTNNAIQVAIFTADTTCPYLSEFRLNLNTGTLSLTFTEPVNTSTFNPTEVTLQSDGTSSPAQLYQLTGGEFHDSIYSQTIVLNLTNYDLNLIKANTHLATYPANTFARLSEYSVQDTTGVGYCNDTVPLDTDTVDVDSTPPELLQFSLDVDGAGVLRLTFSEAVVLPLDLTSITLLAEPDVIVSGASGDGVSGDSVSGDGASGGGGVSGSGSGDGRSGSVPMVVLYSLTGGSSEINYSNDPHIVRVSLTADDLNDIKHLPELAISPNTTLLSLTGSLTSDHSGTPVTAISRSAPLQTANYTEDSTPPQVESFQLDMDQLILTLSFSEVVNITSFDSMAITLQSTMSISNGESYMLLSSSADFKTSSLTEVEVYLSSEDANNIQKTTSLAASSSTTYLSFSSSLVKDTSDLSVITIANSSAITLDPAAYTTDISLPELTAFSFNLSSEVLLLTFDETVSEASLLLTKIAFQSDLVGSNRIPLTGGTVLNVEDSTVIEVRLDDFDLHNIKRDTELATQLNNTCIELDVGAVTDLSSAMNILAPVSSCAIEYAEDLVSPRLIDFEVDIINYGLLTLIFDEPIDIDSINLTSLTLQAAKSADVGVESFTLTGGVATTTNQLQVMVNMSLEDVNVIKQFLTLLRGEASSFLTIMDSFISDVNGNPVTEINTTSALGASGFADDGTQPTLLEFDIDMNSGLLTLFFSETVDVSTFDITGVTLQLDSGVTAPEQFYTLTRGDTLVDYAPTLPVLIHNDNLNILKTRGIGRYNTTVWLSLRNYTVRDILMQPVQEIRSAFARPVHDYTPDTTPSQLESYDIDLTANTLTLFFNETVDISTLDVGEMTLASGPNASETDSVTLTNISRSDSGNLPVIVINIGLSDLNRIKQNTLLATSTNDTYLYFTPFAISDTFGNPVVELTTSTALEASRYTEDSTAPTLLSYDLDMNTGTLTLRFSETVNSTGFDTSGLTLYGDDLGLGQMYQLSGDFDLVTSPADVVELVLTNADLNEIKVLQMLATADNDTFLQIHPPGVRDMRQNDIEMSDLLSVSEYTPDNTVPQLLTFEIDMDAGELTLNFGESVNGSSLQFDHLALLRYETFVPSPANPDDQYQLSSGTVITENGPSITFRFTEADLNEIKRQDMCTREGQEESCFLVLRSNAIADMNSNLIFGCRQSFESF